MFDLISQLFRKQGLYSFLGFINFLFTTLALCLWLHNFFTARSAWGLIVGSKTNSLIAPTESFFSYIIREIVGEQFLHVVSVDKSTITTALIAAFFFFIMRGNYRISKGLNPNQPPANTAFLFEDHFPFPMMYKTYFVQLGLWGTVFAFIVAFSTKPGASESSVNILYEALGTALWSTFSAITLAFILCPLIEKVFSGAVRLNFPDMAGHPAEEIAKTVNAVKKLSEEAENAALKLNALTNGVNANEMINLSSEAQGAATKLKDLTNCVSTSAMADLSGKAEYTLQKLENFAQEVKADTMKNLSEKTENAAQELESFVKKLSEGAERTADELNEFAKGIQKLHEETSTQNMHNQLEELQNELIKVQRDLDSQKKIIAKLKRVFK